MQYASTTNIITTDSIQWRDLCPATEVGCCVWLHGTDPTHFRTGRDQQRGVWEEGCVWVAVAYQLDELRQPEAQLDQNGVGVVADRPDEPVVVAEQVVVQPLGVRVAQAPDGGQEQQRQRRRQLHATPAAASHPELFVVVVAATVVVVADVAVVGRGGVDGRHRVLLGGGRLNRYYRVILPRRCGRRLVGSRMLCVLHTVCRETAAGAPSGADGVERSGPPIYIRRRAHAPSSPHAAGYRQTCAARCSGPTDEVAYDPSSSLSHDVGVYVGICVINAVIIVFFFRAHF